MNSDKEKTKHTQNRNDSEKSQKTQNLESNWEKRERPKIENKLIRLEKEKHKQERAKKIKESSQVDDRDPLESGVDRIWVIRFERVLDRADDPREWVFLSLGLLGHRWWKPSIVEMHFFSVLKQMKK